MRNEESPARVQPIGSAIRASKQASSSGAKSKATASKTKCLQSTAIHEDNIKPQGKKTDHVFDDTEPLTNMEENLITAFIVCSLVGWVYGGYVAACYITPLVFGLFSYAFNR